MSAAAGRGWETAGPGTAPVGADGGRVNPAQRRGGRGGEARMVPDASPRSYYGHPVLKAPVWRPEVPTYLFTGGLAGASAVLAGVARVSRDDLLARRSLLVSLGAVLVSPILLIRDLGRPERFLNMFRVFKVTSPMSVGSWLLLGAGATTGAAVGSDLLGILRPVGRLAEAAAAAIGAPLATYSAVLLTDTAVPAWHEARLEMPTIFAASSVSSAGALAAIVCPAQSAAPARRLAIAGAIVELVGARMLERRLGRLGDVYRQGRAGRLLEAAELLAGSGASMLAVAGRRRSVAVAGGLAVLGGALCERWGIFRAGIQSTKDPGYTVAPQRERIAQREGAAPGPAAPG